MKWFWVPVVCVPLFICGFVRSAETMLQAAGIGVGLIVLGVLGELLSPGINSPAYYDTVSGRQVNADGQPMWSLTEDVERFGPILGFLWCAVKLIFTAVFGGAIIGMFCYGGYAAIRLIF